MDSNLIAILVGLAGSIGAYFGGRQVGKGARMSETMDLVGLLSTQVEALKTQVEMLTAECQQIPGLHQKIQWLEELATQRAQVEEVKTIVTDIREMIRNG